MLETNISIFSKSAWQASREKSFSGEREGMVYIHTSQPTLTNGMLTASRVAGRVLAHHTSATRRELPFPKFHPSPPQAHFNACRCTYPKIVQYCKPGRRRGFRWGLDGGLWSKPQQDWPVVGSGHPHESYYVQSSTLLADETDQHRLNLASQLCILTRFMAVTISVIST